LRVETGESKQGRACRYAGAKKVSGTVLVKDRSVGEVNAPQTEAELSALRRAVNQGCPFGAPFWFEQVVCRLGLHSTLRPQGRPSPLAGASG